MMKKMLTPTVATATAFSLALPVFAQKSVDPYTQGAKTSKRYDLKSIDPYTDGAKTGSLTQ